MLSFGTRQYSDLVTPGARVLVRQKDKFKRLRPGLKVVMDDVISAQGRMACRGDMDGEGDTIPDLLVAQAVSSSATPAAKTPVLRKARRLVFIFIFPFAWMYFSFLMRSQILL